MSQNRRRRRLLMLALSLSALILLLVLLSRPEASEEARVDWDRACTAAIKQFSGRPVLDLWDSPQRVRVVGQVSQTIGTLLVAPPDPERRERHLFARAPDGTTGWLGRPDVESVRCASDSRPVRCANGVLALGNRDPEVACRRHGGVAMD